MSPGKMSQGWCDVCAHKSMVLKGFLGQLLCTKCFKVVEEVRQQAFRERALEIERSIIADLLPYQRKKQLEKFGGAIKRRRIVGGGE